jgi:hypothetical protein
VPGIDIKHELREFFKPRRVNSKNVSEVAEKVNKFVPGIIKLGFAIYSFMKGEKGMNLAAIV